MSEWPSLYCYIPYPGRWNLPCRLFPFVLAQVPEQHLTACRTTATVTLHFCRRHGSQSVSSRVPQNQAAEAVAGPAPPAGHGPRPIPLLLAVHIFVLAAPSLRPSAPPPPPPPSLHPPGGRQDPFYSLLKPRQFHGALPEFPGGHVTGEFGRIQEQASEDMVP